MSNRLESEVSNTNPTQDVDEDDEVNLLNEASSPLTDNEKPKDPSFNLETNEEAQLLDS